ncbi:type II secretion system F family protein [Spirochaetota bacterium]
MIFYYQAINEAGKNISDYVDATSETAARQKIRSNGLYLVKIKAHDVIKTKGVSEKGGHLKGILDSTIELFNKRRSSKEVGLFSRQLATLLKAGLPLPIAITDIIEQIDNKYFRNIVADLKSKLEEGSSFSNAVALHKSTFSEMYVNMVRVGENLGSLDHVIERLADMEEKKNSLKNKIQAALYYPSFMLMFAIIVVMFLLINVIPTISEMFKDQGKDLPLPTEIVIALSGFLSKFWFLIPFVVLVVIYVYKKYTDTEKGKRKVDELKLKLPLVKNLYNKLIVYRFTQNLGILMNNKVDLIKSFEIVEKIVNNKIIEDKINSASIQIREGSKVSKALQQSEFLPKLVLGMISAGEASDNLDNMLLNIGNVYENEIDLTITSLTSLIEPLIIIIMGLLIGTIAMSIMMPMMEMNLLVQ